MPKIDPDIAPLYKEIKGYHAKFRKTLAKKSSSCIQACLEASFGSRVHTSTYYNGNQNECASLTWYCEIIEPYRNILLSPSVEMSFNEDDALSSIVFNDTWIYVALFPLPLTLSIHEVWAKKLRDMAHLLAQPQEPTPAIFDWWSENHTLEHLGWLLSDEEKEANTLDPDAISEAHTDRLQLVLQALDREPENAALHWPSLAPWLQAMRGLMPPPELASGDRSCGGWTSWSSALRTLRLRPACEAVALPQAFEEAMPPPNL